MTNPLTTREIRRLFGTFAVNRQRKAEEQLDEAYSDREPSPHDTPAPWDRSWRWALLAWGLVIGIAIGGWLT